MTDQFLTDLEDRVFREEFARLQESDKPVEEPQSLNPDQGIIGDTVDMFQRGMYQGVQGIGETANQFLPGIAGDAGAVIRDWAGEGANEQLQSISPRMQEAMSKSIFDEDENGALILGEGVSDPRTWLGYRYSDRRTVC